MISAAFIFEPGTYDVRFLALDAKIFRQSPTTIAPP